MADFEIVADSACDLPEELIEKYNLHVVPFYITFDGKTYVKDGVDVKSSEFFGWCKENPGKYPKTSLPTIDDYYRVFEKIVQSGKDIICICINSLFSGSFNSANLAKNMIAESFPDARIEVIDCKLNTHAQGGIVTEIGELKNFGKSLDEILPLVEDMAENSGVVFTTYTLDYLAHGGRIGKLKGLIGQVLKIKPVILFKKGEISSAGIALTKQKLSVKLMEALKYEFKNKNIKDYKFVAGYALDGEKPFVEKFAEDAAEYLGIDKNEIAVHQNGATIGVHTGPESYGIAFIKKQIK